MTAPGPRDLPPGPAVPEPPRTPASRPPVTARGGGAVGYGVAAVAMQPGPPPPAVDHRPTWSAFTAEPVGTQHATAPGAGPRPVALCGADLTDWVVFADRGFDLRGHANCQRCAQLVSAGVRRRRADPGTPGR